MIFGIVPAAGSGMRMRLSDRARAKQYLPLGNGTVLTTTLEALWSAGCFAGLVVLVPEQDVAAVREELQSLPFSDAITVRAGGAERQESVRLGLEAVPPEAEYIVVHDGVRPLVTCNVVLRVVEAAKAHGAATAAVPISDTVKRANDQRFIIETVSREGLWAVQTPQAFRAELLRRAHELALQSGRRFTDDAGIVEAAGASVYIVEGDPRNLKLTRPDDLELARAWLQQTKERINALRVGIGYDVHRLVTGRPLILGGVRIPHEKGLLGHSDADVLSHAVTDALLGAAALGDIGQHFPDTDPKYKDADSIELLRQVVRLVAEKGWRPAQVDAVIAAQRPRLAPHLPRIRLNLAEALDLGVEEVSVKATTTEGLGFVGREEGIEVRAVVTIRGCPSD